MRTNNIKKKQIGGYISRYAIGGKRIKKRKYQGGGMYADNTVASAGQGMAANTASIVYQESDPRLQMERIKTMEEEVSSAKQKADATAAAAEQTIEQGKLTADAAAMAVQQKAAQEQAQLATGLQGLASGLKAVGVGQKAAQSASLLGKGYQLGDLGAKSAQTAFTTTDQALKTGKLLKEGYQLGDISAKSAQAAQASTGLTTGAGTLAKGATLGSKLGKFATSGAGIGLIGAGLSYGVKKAWGDDDPTTATAGDIGAAALSGASTGASIGSFLGPVGTVAGGVIGGIYGGVKSWLSARKARRAKRKAEREYKRKVAKAVGKANRATMKGFGSQLAQVRAGETAQKTYSGYDLGRNVVARMGGMKMGMPRYGAAS